jgi:signal transduction histidine kinase
VLGRRWINSAYNAAQVVLITLVAGFAAGPLSRLDPLHVLRAVLAAVLPTATSTLLAGIAIALFRKEPLPAVVADGFRVSWAQDLADGGIGVAMAVLFVAAPITAVLPLAALPLVYRMNRALEEELRSREQVAAILAAQRRFLTDVAHNVGNPWRPSAPTSVCSASAGSRRTSGWRWRTPGMSPNAWSPSGSGSRSWPRRTRTCPSG